MPPGPARCEGDQRVIKVDRRGGLGGYAGDCPRCRGVDCVQPLPRLDAERGVAGLARVYDALPPDERGRAVIVAGNYGEAGAVDFYGPRHGLPRAVSPAGTYWFFGPGDRPGEIVVALGVPPEELGRFFGEVAPVADVGIPWAVSEERRVPISIGRRPVRTLQAIWPSLRD